ncbi:hypothetical protein [Tellurirhabdus bombi]|uniref:hypothetical protein n=1 Tax=Tellurirhabdus bombi TaxID=2907205 RepID=UPI001F2BED0E|nr:hypothetical protein [Tellurirhabdus bombi]
MYSKNWYEYNFTTDEWTLVTPIDPPRGGGFAGVRGASGFSYQGLGFLLFGEPDKAVSIPSIT